MTVALTVGGAFLNQASFFLCLSASCSSFAGFASHYASFYGKVVELVY